MKLVKLNVKRFQCIESAEVEFGPGLNVLYGPNDLGKSSLAWAIRAALLLQHSSSEHEKFVSWYGGGEPRVELTFTDDKSRYWRVSKTFSGGAAGRSSLEESKDGRTFNANASGREVDEKVRKMLGWGIAGVGGKGKPKGLPDTFLTQVLLAEQDNVRNVLLGTSLSDDPDESGRLKLTEALGALAQDPLFKEILDEAQRYVDRAFTPTGKKKKSADSPFIELSTRINEMSRERDELEAKVRETAAAESRIRELVDLRDKTARSLDDATAAHSAAHAQFQIRRQRVAINEQIATHTATLSSVEALESKSTEARNKLATLESQLEPSAVLVQEATTELQQREARRDQAATHADKITHEDATGAAKQKENEQELAAAREAFVECGRVHERAVESLTRANEIANKFATCLRAVETTQEAAREADKALGIAAGDVARFRDALDHARQRLRDTTSADQAQARELRRTELGNRRLTREGARPPLEAKLREISENKVLLGKVTAAETQRDALTATLAKAVEAVTTAEKTLADHNRDHDRLGALEKYGQLVGAKGAVETAAQSEAAATAARSRAVALRAQEAALRAEVDPKLPPASKIAELRKLREELRVAEARLGGGLSVVIKPRRAIAVRVTKDGAAAPTATISDPLTLSASRALTLWIDDLADVEITAGEEKARSIATELRARWETTGVTTLREQGAETVEQLEAKRSAADAKLRTAEEISGEALLGERAAGDPSSQVDVTPFTVQIAELEAELSALDLVTLGREFAKLGTGWQASLKQAIANSERDRGKLVVALDAQRSQATRLEAQCEGARGSAEELREELTRRIGNASEPLDAIEERCTASLQEIDRDVAAIDEQIAALTETATDEQRAAQAQVTAAETSITNANTALEKLQKAATAARDAAIQATTRLESLRSQAGDHDTAGVWRAALIAGSELSVESWCEAVATALQRRDATRIRCEQLDEKLRVLGTERAIAVKLARDEQQAAEAAVRSGRTTLETVTGAYQQLKTNIAETQVALAQLEAQRATANPDAARVAIAALRREVEALGGDEAVVEQADVDRLEADVTRLQRQVDEIEGELLRARVALEHVGGAIVRERQRELVQTIQHAQTREHQLAVEYDAWALLVETLRQCESTQGAHLGRALATPVSKRFRDLTGARYGALELGAHLEAEGVQAAGERREFGALSAGTQDQLATLLRLCIAEQIHSSIVLDDQLSQSDPTKVSWFNSILRTAAQQIQIVLITCRPGEVLGPEELPAAGEIARSGGAGVLRAIDMTRVIRRFATAP